MLRTTVMREWSCTFYEYSIMGEKFTLVVILTILGLAPKTLAAVRKQSYCAKKMNKELPYSRFEER